MEKLIVFTNKRSIKNFMPEDRERNKVEFKEIKELENKGVMALRGNILNSDYNKEDVLFLASDMIDQLTFKKVYESIYFIILMIMVINLIMKVFSLILMRREKKWDSM